MGLIFRILIGLVLAGLGSVMVIRTRIFLEFFGTIDWAEAKLGGGGSHLMYKLIGIAFIFIGFMVATNLWSAFLEATLGSFF
ncbi:MAG: hypothetical protein ABII13_01510 [Patescibacteria group bacterium]